MANTEEALNEKVENKIAKKIGLLATIISLMLAIGGTVFTAGEMLAQIENNAKSIEAKAMTAAVLHDSISDLSTRVTKVEGGIEHYTAVIKDSVIAIDDNTKALSTHGSDISVVESRVARNNGRIKEGLTSVAVIESKIEVIDSLDNKVSRNISDIEGIKAYIEQIHIQGNRIVTLETSDKQNKSTHVALMKVDDRTLTASEKIEERIRYLEMRDKRPNR